MKPITRQEFTDPNNISVAETQPKDSFPVNDLIDLLRRLAAVYTNPRLGNPSVANALEKISRALLKFKGCDFDEIVPRFSIRVSNHSNRKASAQLSRLSNVDVVSLKLREVRNLLADGQLSKVDLVHLGTTRFGLSRSGLQRMSVVSVVEAVETAMRNEESLDVISSQAARQGARFR